MAIGTAEGPVLNIYPALTDQRLFPEDGFAGVHLAVEANAPNVASLLKASKLWRSVQATSMCLTSSVGEGWQSDPSHDPNLLAKKTQADLK